MSSAFVIGSNAKFQFKVREKEDILFPSKFIEPVDLWVREPQVRTLALEPSCLQPAVRKGGAYEVAQVKSAQAKPETGTRHLHSYSTGENLATWLHLPTRDTGKYKPICVPREKRTDLGAQLAVFHSQWHVWPSCLS